MRDLKACLVCLSVDVKLHSINENQLRQQYYLLTGLQVKKNGGLPEYLCFECNSYVKQFIKFRDKCHRTHFVLQELLEKSAEINKATLKTVNRNAIGVNPFLTLVDLNKMHYEVHYEQATQINQSSYIINDIPTFNYTTLSIEQMSAKTYFPSKSTNATVQENYIKNEDLVIDHQTLDAPIKEEITLEQAASYIDEDDMEDNNDNNDNNDHINSDMEICNNTDKQNANVSNSQRLDNSELEVEFATLYPITKNEAKAVIDINNRFGSSAKFKCTICSKAYQTMRRLDIHLRMHDRHTSGNFWCELCNYYYKTQFMLNNHVTRKHMYKYVCKKCPEVNFDRSSAKKHYNIVHVQDYKVSQSPKRTKRTKNVATVKNKKITRRSFTDSMEYTPVSQEDQYLIIQERKQSRNYTESLFKCEMCFRGFTNPMTYNNHMKKHDPTLSGKYQCDMCKMYRKTCRQLYSHMVSTHLFRYTCKLCSFVCYGRGQAELHDKFHKNITYNCPHCSLTFRKLSSQLTHIRMHHPSTNLCGVCGNSFVSETGLYYHKLKSHTPAEIASVATTELDKSDPFYCSDCNMQFFNQEAFATHFGSSSKHGLRNHSANYNMSQKSRAMRKTRNDRKAKGVAQTTPRRYPGRPRKPRTLETEVLNAGFPSTTNCAICNKLLMSDVQTRKHYAAEHPGAEMPKRFMCEVCGHVTRLHENFLIHMRTHTHEKPYKCLHCDRRFSMASNRDRHLDVHSGIKRYECQHCNRRFTQKSGVKIHIQTVHLKIPYPPWNKKMRRERQALKNISTLTSAVETRETAPVMPKLSLDQGDFLNAFVNYTDE